MAAATRAVLTRAATAEPPLRPRTWRVLAGVLALTACWSRLADEVTHPQLAAATGVEDRRALSRELRELAERRLIDYTPGVGRRLSRVALAVRAEPVDNRLSCCSRGSSAGQCGAVAAE